nr:MAG TPA: hypothetical protein [Caudoviricetes sp.]
MIKEINSLLQIDYNLCYIHNDVNELVKQGKADKAVLDKIWNAIISVHRAIDLLEEKNCN